MDRGRQVIRQWKLLQVLEGAHLGASAQQLHERLDEECVERTVRRDLEALQAVGFPIACDQGRWRLLRTGPGAWSVPVEPSMVVALMVSEALLEGSPLAGPLHELRSRVEAMLGPQGRAWCRALHQRVAVNAPPVARVPDGVELAVDTAIQECRRLRICYWSRTSGDTERTVDPLVLYHVQGGLYVLAWDDRSGERRMFAVQRISRAELLDERFEPDPAFDVAAYLGTAFGVMAGPAHRMIVDFAPHVAHLIRERSFHASQHLQDLDGGWLRTTWTMAGLPEVARWLAGFGGDVRVVSPVALQEALLEIHRGGVDTGGHQGH